jgi:hypothetical protein
MQMAVIWLRGFALCSCAGKFLAINTGSLCEQQPPRT